MHAPAQFNRSTYTDVLEQVPHFIRMPNQPHLAPEYPNWLYLGTWKEILSVRDEVKPPPDSQSNLGDMTFRRRHQMARMQTKGKNLSKEQKMEIVNKIFRDVSARVRKDTFPFLPRMTTTGCGIVTCSHSAPSCTRRVKPQRRRTHGGRRTWCSAEMDPQKSTRLAWHCI